jgi:hypothetical protein
VQFGKNLLLDKYCKNKNAKKLAPAAATSPMSCPVEKGDFCRTLQALLRQMVQRKEVLVGLCRMPRVSMNEGRFPKPQ